MMTNILQAIMRLVSFSDHFRETVEQEILRHNPQIQISNCRPYRRTHGRHPAAPYFYDALSVYVLIFGQIDGVYGYLTAPGHFWMIYQYSPLKFVVNADGRNQPRNLPASPGDEIIENRLMSVPPSDMTPAIMAHMFQPGIM
jgi:hypothetical protein